MIVVVVVVKNLWQRYCFFDLQKRIEGRGINGIGVFNIQGMT
jgi:hypothetical protein